MALNAERRGRGRNMSEREGSVELEQDGVQAEGVLK
jgi:hypothetical protein